MTMVWLVASLVSPWFFSYVLVRRCDPGARGAEAARWLHACLAVGIGLGLSSCTYLIWLLCFGPPGRVFSIVESLGFAVGGLLGLAGGRLRRSTAAVPAAAVPAVPPTLARRWQAILLAAFIAALAFDAIGLGGRYATRPHGEFDAGAIWNARARFLFRAGDDWRQAFLPVHFHSDYPLLIPLSSDRCWSCLGCDSQWVPALVGDWFTLAAVGVLVAGVCRLRSRSQGLLAGMVLLGTKTFVIWGAAQCADVPLAFFILATVLLLGLDDASEQSSRGLLLLAGLCAALAAWTKNEGWLFFVVVLAVRAVVAWRRGGGRQMLRQSALLLAGAAPALAVVMVFKFSLATGNDLVSGQSWQASLPRLADASRYWLIVKALVLNLVALVKVYVLVLPLCFFLLGRAPRRPRLALHGIVGVLGLMLAGYFFVYLTTPCDLTWHLSTSAIRLLMHLWPAAILAMFLSLSDPVQLLAERSAASPASHPWRRSWPWSPVPGPG
jgi:hypothetical protein